MEAENVRSIIEWCKVCRPDLSPQIKQIIQNDALFLLMAIGFEAGRTFQKANPTCPLGFIPTGDWKTVTEELKRDMREDRGN